MKEIKFRVYDKYLNILFKVLGIDFDKNGNIVAIQTSHHTYRDQALQELKIMQYTALKDKNGKEIHEEDILARNNNSQKHIIKWNNEKAGFILNAITFINTELAIDTELALGEFIFTTSSIKEYIEKECLEIIGNSYENPEMLDAKVEIISLEE